MSSKTTGRETLIADNNLHTHIEQGTSLCIEFIEIDPQWMTIHINQFVISTDIGMR